MIERTDLGICVIFWFEFIVGLLKTDHRGVYIKARWADILGMVPVTDITLRSIRLFRLFRIVRVTRAVRLTKLTRTFKLLTRTEAIRLDKLVRYTRRFLKKLFGLSKLR